MKPTRLSYSSVALHKRCPKAWRYNYIERLPRPMGEAASRGSALHSQVDKFFKGELSGDKLSVEFWRVREDLANIRALTPFTEMELLVDGDWSKVDDEQSAVWKAIVDILYPVGDALHIIDLKSGRMYDEHVLQLALYAAISLACFPDARRVYVSALYLDMGIYGHSAIYAREQLADMQVYWNEARDRIAGDEQLLPTPSFTACRYCPYSVKKGGPCTDYWREEPR